MDKDRYVFGGYSGKDLEAIAQATFQEAIALGKLVELRTVVTAILAKLDGASLGLPESETKPL